MQVILRVCLLLVSKIDEKPGGSGRQRRIRIQEFGRALAVYYCFSLLARHLLIKLDYLL
jgi:hypothetical protein